MLFLIRKMKIPAKTGIIMRLLKSSELTESTSDAPQSIPLYVKLAASMSEWISIEGRMLLPDLYAIAPNMRPEAMALAT